MEIFDNVATIQQIAVEDHFQEKYDEMLRIREGPLKKVSLPMDASCKWWNHFRKFDTNRLSTQRMSLSSISSTSSQHVSCFLIFRSLNKKPLQQSVYTLYTSDTTTLSYCTLLRWVTSRRTRLRVPWICFQNLVSVIGYKTFTMSESFKEMVSASSAAKLVFNLIDPSMEKSREAPTSQMVSFELLFEETQVLLYLLRLSRVQ